MLSNLGPTIDALKPKLREYIKKKGLSTKGRLFQCFNYKGHRNNDLKPSCNFLDKEETKFHCYMCASSGDIFDACHLLEGMPLSGSGFHDTVEYLAKLLKVPYTVAQDTAEDRFMHEVDRFLDAMAKQGTKNLKNLLLTNPSHPAVKLLKAKGWDTQVDKYRLGIIFSAKSPTTSKIKDICSYLNLDLPAICNQLIIPITFDKHLVGFQTRTLVIDKKDIPEDVQKYKTYLVTNKVVFGLDSIDHTKPVYLVEGISSVITMDAKGLTNAVAILGNHLSQKQYESLVSNGITSLKIILDNDQGGDEGRKNVLSIISGKKDFKTTFLYLPEAYKDPGDASLADVDFSSLVEKSVWEVLLDCQNSSLMIKYIASQTDLMEKDKLISELAKKSGSMKASIIEEVGKEEEKLGDEVPTALALKEKDSIIQTVNAFEKWAWSRGSLLGLKSFECFDKALEGLQEGLILIGGPPGVGKSNLMTSTAIKLIDRNPDVYIVYITIDDSAIVTTSRFVANLSGIPINIVSNPKYRITDNPLFTPEEKRDFILRRERAIEYLRKNVSTFNMKESQDGYTIEYILALLRSIEPIIAKRQLVVMIDNLHRLKSTTEFKNDKSLVDSINNNLKIISGKYHAPVICTVEHTKSAIQTGEVGGTALKETSSLHYNANVIMTVIFKQMVGTFQLVDVLISKNKMSAYKGSLTFKMFPDLSKMEEEASAKEIFE